MTGQEQESFERFLLEWERDGQALLRVAPQKVIDIINSLLRAHKEGRK